MIEQRHTTSFGLVGSCYRYFFRNFGLFAKTAAAPVVFFSVLPHVDPESVVRALLTVALSVVLVPAYAMFWHRTILARENSYAWYAPAFCIIGLAPGTFGFFVPYLLFTLISVGAFLTGLTIGWVLVVGLSILCCIFFSRLALILPAKAVARREYAIGDSWRMTRGLTMPLTVGVILVPFVPLVLSGVVSSMSKFILFLVHGEVSHTGGIVTFAADVISNALGFAGVSLIATLLSLVYLSLGGEVPDRSKIAAGV